VDTAGQYLYVSKSMPDFMKLMCSQAYIHLDQIRLSIEKTVLSVLTLS
jgi:hypothetical protein